MAALSTRAWPLAALALAGALTAPGSPLGLAMLALGLIPLLLGAGFCWWGTRHLQLLREPLAEETCSGQALNQGLRLENRSGLWLPRVEVVDRSSLGSGSVRRLALPRGASSSWVQVLHPLQRGSFELGPTAILVSDPLRLFRFPVPLPAPPPRLLVRPAPARLPESVLANAYGDRGRGSVLLLLDLSRATKGASMELGLRLAATLLESALESGRKVAMAASDSRLGRFPADSGESHRARLLAYLATARADGELSFAGLVRSEMGSWRGRGRVVLLSSDSQPGWAEAAAVSSRPGERALGVFLGDQLATSPARWRLALELWSVSSAEQLAGLGRAAG